MNVREAEKKIDNGDWFLKPKNVSIDTHHGINPKIKLFQILSCLVGQNISTLFDPICSGECDINFLTTGIDFWG